MNAQKKPARTASEAVRTRQKLMAQDAILDVLKAHVPVATDRAYNQQANRVAVLFGYASEHFPFQE